MSNDPIGDMIEMAGKILLLLWRLPWFIAAQVFRIGFTICVLGNSGYDNARRAWEDTE